MQQWSLHDVLADPSFGFCNMLRTDFQLQMVFVSRGKLFTQNINDNSSDENNDHQEQYCQGRVNRHKQLVAQIRNKDTEQDQSNELFNPLC